MTKELPIARISDTLKDKIYLGMDFRTGYYSQRSISKLLDLLAMMFAGCNILGNSTKLTYY